MPIAHNCDIKANKIKEKLSQEFEIKDLGSAKSCIFIEIERSKNELKIVQRKKSGKAIEKFNMMNANMLGRRAEPSLMYQLIKRNKYLILLYRELIGVLTYIAVCTRSEIIQSTVLL